MSSVPFVGSPTKIPPCENEVLRIHIPQVIGSRKKASIYMYISIYISGRSLRHLIEGLKTKRDFCRALDFSLAEQTQEVGAIERRRYIRIDR